MKCTQGTSVEGPLFYLFPDRVKPLQVSPAGNNVTETDFNISQSEHFKNRVFWHFWHERQNELFN